MKTFKTERLVLKELSLKDAEDMYEYAKIPVVGNSAGWSPHKNIRETKSILNMIISSKEVHGIYLNNKLIGTLGIHKRDGSFALGYVLHPDYWNNGYMTEACKGVIKEYFNNPLNKKLYATTFIDNIGSQKVLLKLGFKFVKEVEREIKNKKELMFMYKLKKEEFKGE